MHFPVKSALVATLSLCSFTAAIASGVSQADEAPSVMGAKQPITISSSQTVSAASAQAVRFAPRKEIVQPLKAQTAIATGQSSTPRAADFIAEPDKEHSSLSELVRAVDTAAPLDEETKCLATAIYYEARSESLEGQLAVGRVIVNRAESSRFGNSLCGVVKQPGQFSFVRRGVLPEPNMSRASWKTSIAMARIAQNNAWESKAEGALFFHARRVSPGWSRARVAVIDNHVFYR